MVSPTNWEISNIYSPSRMRKCRFLLLYQVHLEPKQNCFHFLVSCHSKHPVSQVEREKTALVSGHLGFPIHVGAYVHGDSYRACFHPVCPIRF